MDGKPSYEVLSMMLLIPVMFPLIDFPILNININIMGYWHSSEYNTMFSNANIQIKRNGFLI
jgi:hypothetical protein